MAINNKKDMKNQDNKGKVKIMNGSKTDKKKDTKDTYSVVNTKSKDEFYSIHFNEKTDVGMLKGVLKDIPDNTLVRVAGRSDGFAQVDTTYSDLNFCVAEGKCCCDEEPKTVIVGKELHYLADLFSRMLNREDMDKTDEFNKASIIKACETLEYEYNQFLFIIDALANGTEETEIEDSLYREVLCVIGLANAICNYEEYQLSEGSSDEACEVSDCDSCKDKEECEEIVEEAKHYIKTLQKVTHLDATTKLRLNFDKGWKLTDEQKSIIISELVPSGISDLSVKCGLDCHGRNSFIDVKFTQEVDYPFGKKTKGSRRKLIKKQEKAVKDSRKAQTKNTEVTFENAKCIRDDEDDD